MECYLKYIEVLGFGVPKQSEGGHCTSKKGNKRFVSGVISRVSCQNRL